MALGVALEGPELFHDIRNICRRKQRDARPWVKVLGLVGWIFVVGGVAGECVFEGYLSVTDGQIQKFDEILLADAQQQVVATELFAGTAAESAHRAQESATTIGAEATAIGKQEALLSSKITADEATEAALRKALLPRGLDPSKLIVGLSPFVLWKVRIDTVADTEALRAANLIATSLRGAHWAVLAVNSFIGADIPDGIQVKEHCVWSFTRRQIMTDCGRAGARLTAALSNAGLPDVSFGGTDNTLEDNSFDIIIGLRKVPSETVPNVSRQSQ